MPFKYDKLWKMLDDRDMSREQLRVAIRASQTTISKMGDNQNVSLDVIDRICSVLNCAAADILEFIPNEDAAIKIREPLERGDIYLTGLPQMDGSEESSSTRPVIIVQATALCRQYPYVLIAPFTSRIQNVVEPFSVIVDSDGISERKTAVQLIRTMPVRATLLYKKVGRLAEDDIRRVDRCLTKLFDL